MFIRVRGVIHLIGYILVMQMFFFNFRGVESKSKSEIEEKHLHH